VIVASLELSSTFDPVNVKNLENNWLSKWFDRIDLCVAQNRTFFVSLDVENSTLVDLLLGTVQGSILVPMLYSIFVFIVFHENLSAFADDTFIPRSNKSLALLRLDLEKSLEAIRKWLKQSGLEVNQSKNRTMLIPKTRLCSSKN
jgi:hypothetical protein